MIKRHNLIIDACFVIIIVISLFTMVSIGLSSKEMPAVCKDDNLLISQCSTKQDTVLGQKVIRDLDYLIMVKHQVMRGEQLAAIAKKYDTTIDSIRSSNYLYSLEVRTGQNIIVPNQVGTAHKVARGETLESIANTFKSSKLEISEINNGITDYTKLAPKTLVFIPDVKISFPEYGWPATGRISSSFGYRNHPIWGEKRFHDGMDIAGRYNSQIRAAREGRVIFAGWRSGYGRLIMIKHNDGSVAYYGHLASCNVRNKQWVGKGQNIGRLGSSGWSTGPHLHFEIRKNGRAVNPSWRLKQTLNIVSLKKEKK